MTDKTYVWTDNFQTITTNLNLKNKTIYNRFKLSCKYKNCPEKKRVITTIRWRCTLIYRLFGENIHIVFECEFNRFVSCRLFIHFSLVHCFSVVLFVWKRKKKKKWIENESEFRNVYKTQWNCLFVAFLVSSDSFIFAFFFFSFSLFFFLFKSSSVSHSSVVRFKSCIYCCFFFSLLVLWVCNTLIFRFGSIMNPTEKETTRGEKKTQYE